MTKYLANDTGSIEAFVKDVEQLNDKQTRWFLAGLVNAGLMNLHFENAAELNTLGENAGVSDEDAIIVAVNFQTDETISELLEEAIQHIESGTDETPNSDAVGGWNQNELTLATGILEYAQTV